MSNWKKVDVSNWNNATFPEDEKTTRDVDDVPKNLLGNQTGFYFGKRIVTDNRGVATLVEHVMKPHNEDGNILVAGRSGDGKTTALAKPTLEKSSDVGIFAVDMDSALAVVPYRKIYPQAK